ncbi:tail fiber protein [Cronobacter muytjensii]|uniref:tail fiber protein n=1 Tax=Cronobacter muytjensii TaxID=413501 RepID=UPI0015880555|nr:tail fiber protein [Cronobacter muytjensii]NUW60849.1 tail fiber protein [Cronobacter muytjensii]
MSAGTLALTNKSDAVKGTGTTFTEMKAGDFIVVSIGGTPYTLTVNSITSDTQLTIISNFTGPTQSGLAWYEVPREAQSLITAALATQTTEALRGQNLDKDNWQQVFSVSDDITVTLNDGSQFTGPSWLKVADLIKDVDIPSLQTIANQVSQDASAAELSREEASLSSQSAINAANAATGKASEALASAQAAKTSENTSTQKASDATQSAAAAKTEADRARAEADRAASAAGDVDFTMSDVKKYVDAAVPVGVMLEWPSNILPDNPEIGLKFLRLNGAAFNKTLYPKLAELYPSGVLPDMRGNVARGFDDGRGIDTGRALLSEQLDAAPNITGSFAPSVDSRGFGSGSISCTGGVAAGYVASTDPTFLRSVTASIDASKSSVAYGRENTTEIRMRNMAWNMIVRAA